MAVPTRILIVDDERSMREMLTILLQRQGHEVVSASSGSKAIALLEAGERFDLAITDLLMDRGGGIDVLTAVKACDPSCEVILITAFGTTESAVEAMKKGAFDYIAKPFNLDEFGIIVRQALERQALIRENIRLKARMRGQFRFADIVGRSPAMREVIAVCRKVSDSNAAVLVSGESGTGKEVVARAIHHGGPRASAPFVAVNCGAFPEQLMESELFGHARGAFTGATEDKEGLFQAASGGTVFLDEVGELPAALQVKLLRVLQDHRVRPVGSNEERHVDVRVISATNRDLEELIAEGRFRTDLFYRLNVISIHIPPLRERTEDIPPLVEELVARHATETEGIQRPVTSAAMRLLLAHEYPGNVRELANILERAATLAEGDAIDAGDLPPEIVGGSRRQTGVPDLSDDGIDLDGELARIERAMIERALERTGGVRTSAAELLGITLRSLRYRLEKLGVDSSDE